MLSFVHRMSIPFGCLMLQAACSIGNRTWLHRAGIAPGGPWLARADSKTRRAALLQLLPLLQCRDSTSEQEPDMTLMQAGADIVVGLCLVLRQQLSTPGAVSTCRCCCYARFASNG